MPSATETAPGTKAGAEANGSGSDEAARKAAQAAADEAAAAGGGTGEEDDGQLFVMEAGKTVTLGTLIKRGIPVEYEFRLDGKSVKGKDMALIAFDDPEITLVVPARAGKVVADPTYDADGALKSVTVRAHVKPKLVYDARTEAARAALGG